MYRLHINYDKLRSPDLDMIETWAAPARNFELSDVLKRLATLATLRDYTTQNLQTVAPGGLPVGEPRVRWVGEGADHLKARCRQVEQVVEGGELLAQVSYQSGFSCVSASSGSTTVSPRPSIPRRRSGSTP
jgi:hypothetical protein